MDAQVRGNRGRGGSGELQDGRGSPTAGPGRGWQGDGGRGGGRQRERRRRRVSGGIYIWWRVASPGAAAALIPQLLAVLLWLCIIINNYLPLVDHGRRRVVYLYQLYVRPVDTPKCGAAPEVSQPDLSAVKAELFRLCPSQFPAKVVAYDGRRSPLSQGLLPEVDFRMAVHGRVFRVTFKLVKSVTSFGSETHPYAKHLWDVVWSF